MTMRSATFEATRRLLQAGHFAQAELHCHQVLQEDPGQADAWHFLGEALQGQQKHSAAAAAFRRCLDLQPHSPDALIGLGLALVGLGQRVEAAAAFQEALRWQPSHAEARTKLGVILAELGRLDDAITQLREAVRHSPDLPQAHHNLGVALAQQGKLEQALASLREALRLKPEYPEAQSNLGIIVAALGKRYQAPVPTGSEVAALVQEGLTLLARGEYARARRVSEKASTRFPQALGPRRLLSQVLLQEGSDSNAAARALQDVLTLVPDDGEARDSLCALLRQRRAQGDPLNATAIRQRLYQAVCRFPSDIHEHCPTLHALARKCRHVTELGTRAGHSTLAFLHAQPEQLISYDRDAWPHCALLEELAERTTLVFQRADVLEVEIEPTDLLFIDTWHVYEQLQRELQLHAHKAQRYIVLHDTTTFAEQGETAGHRGLWPAIEEFLALDTFRLKKRYKNNNGLTVLEAVQRPANGK